MPQLLNGVVLGVACLAALLTAASSGAGWRRAAVVLCAAVAGVALIAGSWAGVPVAVVSIAVGGRVRALKRDAGVGRHRGAWGALFGAGAAAAAARAIHVCARDPARPVSPSATSLVAIATAVVSILAVQGLRER